MEILDVIWLNSATTVGIVIAKNEIGEIHSYTRAVNGFNETEDIKTILEYGCKRKLSSLIDELKKYDER